MPSRPYSDDCSDIIVQQDLIEFIYRDSKYAITRKCNLFRKTNWSSSSLFSIRIASFNEVQEQQWRDNNSVKENT